MNQLRSMLHLHRKGTPKSRLRRLNRKFSKLKLDDFIRQYTDKSALTKIKQPDVTELNAIFRSMEKNSIEERNINCGACGYSNCHDMAIAIFNGCNRPEGCIQFEKKKVEQESEKILALSQEAREQNERIAAFVANDFDKLDIAITEVAQGNEQTALETCDIQSAMEDIRQFCDEMSDSFDGIAALLAELERNNKNITKLSKQTGLLSLNASVEAVHAGEAGHGFAVVASEMKELSDSCEQAASDSIVNKEEISAAMSQLSQKASELKAQVNVVSDHMIDLAARTEQINAAADSVSEVSKNVRTAMEELSQAK
jgi:Na+-translocating ferredoxin:NAD+ oxidoreductase RNF subunit RnfB